MGDYTFTYVAVDAFKNKAKCSFTIKVVDRTPPSMENCYDEVQVILIPSNCSATPTALTSDRSSSPCYIQWNDPIIYDNSNDHLWVTQSLNPGYLSVGQYDVLYSAEDNSGNRNSCTIKLIVKHPQCDVLRSPLHGQSVCAKNATHTWCDVTCDHGHGIYDEIEQSHIEHVQLMCHNDFAKWKYDVIPDCTLLSAPLSMGTVFSLTMDAPNVNCSTVTDEVRRN